ncbi:MAG: enoyl-CoA hydratase-related protein [Promethearchaeota archaeon]
MTKMEYKQILFEVSDQIATLTLNRPEKLNAITWDMRDELWDAIMKIENNPDIRVTILTGAGRAFCAGADLGAAAAKGSADDEDNPEWNKDKKEFKKTMIERYFSLKKPVIVAYNGACVGVGVTMTLPFDIRIAAESARIGIVFSKRGIIPEIASPWILPRLIGISRAAELMFTGRIINAKEALEFGLVNRVVPDDKLMDTAKEIAQEIISNAPVSVALTKQMLYQFLGEPDILKAEQINKQYFQWVTKQADTIEGVTSFFQKRKPKWKLKVPGDMPDFFPIK